jgi:hypothetical protein
MTDPAMNEYLPRSEPVSSVASSMERGSRRLNSAEAVTATSPVADDQALMKDRKPAAAAAPVPLDSTTLPSDDAAAAADVARVHQRIADILANLRNQSGASAVNTSNSQLQSLVSEPVVLLPMPPTSREAIEFAEQLAKSMIQQAAMARVAQTSPRAAAVDQLIS